MRDIEIFHHNIIVLVWVIIEMIELMSAEERELFASKMPPTLAEKQAAELAWRDLSKKGRCWEDRVTLKLTRRLAAPVRLSDNTPPIAIVATAGHPYTLPARMVQDVGTALRETADKLADLLRP